jgi:deazaflavin-dependent oxidoreductase (nitroreductase family)
MFITIVRVVAGLAAVAAVLWLAFTVSFRTKFRPVQNAIRRTNRKVLNPRQLRRAGKPGAWASVVRHVGRSSGTAYRTPVVTVPTPDGFVIALPYGPGVDWARNVIAAGSATIEHDGRTIRVDAPAVVSAAEANPFFPPGAQRTHRLYGVDDFLLLRRSGEPETASSEVQRRAADV